MRKEREGDLNMPATGEKGSLVSYLCHVQFKGNICLFQCVLITINLIKIFFFNVEENEKTQW